MTTGIVTITLTWSMLLRVFTPYLQKSVGSPPVFQIFGIS